MPSCKQASHETRSSSRTRASQYRKQRSNENVVQQESQTKPSKIVIDNLTVRFADRSGMEDVVAVDHVNMMVADGEFVCIVGPSGCGKTTLLRVLAELQPVSSGTARIERTDPNRPPTAMVFQGASVFPWMSVIDNVAYGLRTR